MSTRKPAKRVCSRFQCVHYKKNYCCIDCNKKYNCSVACKNSPEKCGLLLKKVST